MKRVGCAVVVLALLLAAAGWLLGAHLLERLRSEAESRLSDAVAVPCRIDALDWSWAHRRLSVRGVHCGEAVSALRIGEIALRLHLGASLAERRPVASLELLDPVVDFTRLRLPKNEPAHPQASSVSLPAFRLAGLELRGALVTFPYGAHSKASVGLDALHAALEAAADGARGELFVVGAVLEQKDRVLRVHDAHVVGGWHPGTGAYAESAAIDGEGVHLTAAATDKPGTLHAQAELSPEVLGAFVDDLVFLNGAVFAEATLSGDLIDPVVDASLLWSGAAVAGHPVGDLTTRFLRHGTDLSFDDIYVFGPAGRLSGMVRMTVHEEVPIHGHVTAEGLMLREVVRRSGAAVEFATTFGGGLTLEGQLDPLDLRISGSGDAQAGKDSPPAGWEAEVDLRPHSVAVSGHVEQPPANRAEVALRIDGGQFGGSASLRAGDVASLRGLLPLPAAGLAMTGKVAVDARFTGTAEHPHVSAEVDGERLTIMGSPVPRLKGGVDISAGALEARAVRIETAGGSFQLDGTLGLEPGVANQLELAANRFDTDVLVAMIGGFTGVSLPVRGGMLRGTVSAHGTLDELAAEVDLRGEGWRLGREPVQLVELAAALRNGRWQGSLGVQHTGRESMSVRANGTGMEAAEIVVDSTPIALGGLIGAGKLGLSGSARVDGRLRGPLSRPAGSLRLSVEGLQLQEHALGDVALQAEANERAWTLTGSNSSEQVRLQATVDPKGRFAFEANGGWRQLDLSALLPSGADAKVETTGTLNLRGTLSPFALADGHIEVPEFDVSRDAYAVRAASPLRFRVSDGSLTIERFELMSGDTRLHLGGSIGADGRVNLEARGDGDLVLLELLGRPIEAARGPFAIAATVRCDDGAWTLAGSARLDDASADLGLPVSFTQTSARVRLQGSEVYLDSLTGRAGSGRFDVSGSMDLRHGADVRWEIHDVGMNVADGLEARLRGSGRLSGAWDGLVLDGDIEIVNALYDKDIALEDLFDWLTKQLLPQVELAGGEEIPLRLNVRLHSRGGVFVDDNIAKAEMWVDLQIQGNAAKPRLGGRIGFVDGEVTFRGRTFTITSGSIDFRDDQKINPALNISAESRVTTPDTDYIVSVVVTGTAEKPKVQFSADDPAISQNDVLSLVAFGRTRAQMQREATSFSPTATAIGLLPTGGVEKRVEELLGIDRFEVSATQARDSGAIEPRVTMGKDLTDQFRAIVWSSFGVQARQAVQLEYRWTRRLSLLSSWESQTQSSAGAFGGDVKVRFEFRRIPLSFLDTEIPLSPDGYPLAEGGDGAVR